MYGIRTIITDFISLSYANVFNFRRNLQKLLLFSVSNRRLFKVHLPLSNMSKQYVSI